MPTSNTAEDAGAGPACAATAAALAVSLVILFPRRPGSYHHYRAFAADHDHLSFFSTEVTGVSGFSPGRARLCVSRPFASQSPAAVRCANRSHVSLQSPSV